MIYISCSAQINHLGEFRISSIYCVSDFDSYFITRESGWRPLELHVTKEKLQHIVETQHFSIESVVYSPIRVLNGDESATEFLDHVSESLRKLDTTEFHKKLFRVICELGESYDI